MTINVFAVTFVLMLVTVVGFGFVSSAEAATLSLLKQYNSGVSVENLTCNNPEHSLAIRDNGKPICASESTLTKLGFDIYKSFENDVALSVQTVDLSGVVLKSDVTEGDYLTGTFTESMKGVMRGPAPIPISSLGMIVNQDGSTQFASSFAAQSRSASPSFTVDDYLQYFPTFIPDGQELKFFTFETAAEGATLSLIYAPIVVEVDPLTLTMGEHQDIGGITFKIIDLPGKVWLTQDDYDRAQNEGAEILDLHGKTVVKGVTQLKWNTDDGKYFRLTTGSYFDDTLLQMADTAIQLS